MNWTSCDYLKEKEWVYDFQKGWSWNLKWPNGSALGQDIWRAATNFTNWVLIMLLVVEGGKHNESVLSAKPAKQHRLVKAPG